jgi:hypothetical protein
LPTFPSLGLRTLIAFKLPTGESTCAASIYRKGDSE